MNFIDFCYLFGFISLTGASVAMQRKFPEHFHFGASSSSYQIEGAWNVSDKGETICDRFMHEKNPSIDGSSGDASCESYYYWRDDIAILKQLGVHFYRFSISWARLLPTGFPDHISEDGKKYYNDLIDELLENNIQPMVTILHFDLPQVIQDLGGWANPLITMWIEDYARVVLTLFGDRVKLWLTINEPAQTCYYGYGKELLAPAVNWPGVADYLCVKNLMVSHARIWRMFDEEFRPKYGGKMGLSVHLFWYYPRNATLAEDRKAARDAMTFHGDIFIQPILGPEGNFPKEFIEKIAKISAKEGQARSRLPEMTAEEVDLIKGATDFLGVNYYTSYSASFSKRRVTDIDEFLYNDLGVKDYFNPNWKRGASFWLQVHPEGLRQVLRYVKEKYNNPQILVTENGFSSLPGIQDDDRVDYLTGHLNAVLDAIYIDGVNVTHYTVWSLMDNFEWYSGYTVRFGLYDVDFNDPKKKRRPKKSALVYKEIIKTRTVDPFYDPNFSLYVRNQISNSIT